MSSKRDHVTGDRRYGRCIALWNPAQQHQEKLNLQTVSEGLPTLKEAFTKLSWY
jgi:hypothetical protein